MDNKTRIMMKYSDKVLKLIDEKAYDEMPRGDLQGVIEAIILNTYYEARKDITI